MNENTHGPDNILTLYLLVTGLCCLLQICCNVPLPKHNFCNSRPVPVEEELYDDVGMALPPGPEALPPVPSLPPPNKPPGEVRKLTGDFVAKQ